MSTDTKHPVSVPAAKVGRRTWPLRAWKALTRFAWIALAFFFAQNAMGSRLENEPRAALLYWMLTAVVVLAGGIVSLNRRVNSE